MLCCAVLCGAYVTHELFAIHYTYSLCPYRILVLLVLEVASLMI